MHFEISLVKSILRLVSCVVALAIGSWYPIAILFIAAEILGILEEALDDRK